MLKISKIAGLIIGCMSLTVLSACTRDFTCQCTMSSEGHPGLPSPEVNEYPITDTKQNAKKTCEAASRVYEDNGIVTHEDCKLF